MAEETRRFSMQEVQPDITARIWYDPVLPLNADATGGEEDNVFRVGDIAELDLAKPLSAEYAAKWSKRMQDNQPRGQVIQPHLAGNWR